MKVYTKVVYDIASGEVLEEESYEYSGPVAEAKGDGGGGTTINKTEPWAEQKPYLLDVFKNAQQIYQTHTPQAFPDNTTAPYTQQEQTALQNLWDYANTQAPQFIGKVTVANEFALGDVLNPASNVALQQAAAGAVRPVFEQLQQGVIPQIQSEALKMGQYGGSRQQAATTQAIDRAVQDALDTTAKMYSDNYANSLNAFTRGLAIAPAVQQLQTAPMQLQSAVGEAYRNYEQSLINDAIARWNFEQNLPYEKLAQYATAVNGGYGGTSTVQSNLKGPSTGSRILGGLGGALSGAASGAMFGGTAMGAALGGAAVLGPLGAVIGLASAFM